MLPPAPQSRAYWALLTYAQGPDLVFNWEIYTFRYFLHHL